MAGVSPERQRAIALACLVEPGTPGIAELVAEHGADEVLARLGTQRRASRVVGRLDPEQVPEMLAEMSRRGVRVVLPGEPEFPSQLLDLPEPPLALWIRGPLDLRAAALRSVAVVGARACTAYGERATAAVAGGLAEDGWAVVSGGAFGIDAAAHRAALAVGGPTVAVLACGVDVAYPRAHDALLARIADSGLVVSELPPGSQPLKHRFLARNRVIAALSRGHGRRGGRPAQWCGVDGLAGVGARPGGHGRARAGHLDGQLRDQPPAARAGGAGRQRQRRGRLAAHWRGSRRTPPRGSARADVDGRAARRPVSAACPTRPARFWRHCPSRGNRSVESAAERVGISPAACLAHLGLLEIVGLARRAGPGWRRCA